MANLDAPKGFRYVRSATGTVPFMNHYVVTAATKVYPGDACILTTGEILPSAAAADEIFGIVAGYGDGDSTLNYEKNVLVYPLDLNPGAIFEVQMNGGLAASTMIGQYVATAPGAPDATLKQSRFQVTDTPQDKLELPLGFIWRIVGIADDPRNEPGAANARIHVVCAYPASEITAGDWTP